MAPAPPLSPTRAFDWWTGSGAGLQGLGWRSGRGVDRAGPRPLCPCGGGGGGRCARGDRAVRSLAVTQLGLPPDGARGRAGPVPGSHPRPRVTLLLRPRACHLQPPRPPPCAAPAPPAAAWGTGPQTPAPDPHPDPGARGPWPARGTAASRWPSGRGRRAREGLGLCVVWARGHSVRSLHSRRRGCVSPVGRMEGGFVWVVISGPSWEPLIIRKSNKQGNPVFHTQLWPELSVCVSSSPPRWDAVSYGGVGGNCPLPTPAGWFCALGPARRGNTPGREPSADKDQCRAGMVPCLCWEAESPAGPVPRGDVAWGPRKRCPWGSISGRPDGRPRVTHPGALKIKWSGEGPVTYPGFEVIP